MEGYTWTQLLLFFFIYCFLGWIFESVYVSVVERKWTNRGFLRGPMIPIYGFGAIMIIVATTPFRGNYAAEFVSGMLAATLFEYVVGVFMEAIFKVKYWDYSHKPFQYKGYICLESSVCWGFLSVIAAEVLQTRLEQFVFAIPSAMASAVAGVVLVLFSIDTVLSVRDAWGVRNIVLALSKLKTDLEGLQGDLEARSEEFLQLLEERLKTKKEELEQVMDELEQLRNERKEQLSAEVKQLYHVIEQERQERELAHALFVAHIEKDVAALQLKMEQDREGLYEKLKQAKAEYEDKKLSQIMRENMLLRTLYQHEEQLEQLLQKRGSILRRNPNAVSRQLGNVQKHITRQKQQKQNQNVPKP